MEERYVSQPKAAQILLFYKYVTVEEPEVLAENMRLQAASQGLLGRILVAQEGINGTVEGSVESTEAFADILTQDPRFATMNIKRSHGTGDAFRKLTVKVREEIVGTHFPKEIDPREQTATYLSPDELRAWYENNKDFVVVDMRNSYEYVSGHFKNSIDPGMEASRDLPKVMDRLKPLKDKTVVTVCTGGIRCEKMSAYLLHQGFKNVYQLHNGIHAYMEKYPGKDFLGTLYTFDKRHTMHFGGEREVVGECVHCKAKTERYADCGVQQCRVHFLACESCMPEAKNAACKNCIHKTAPAT
jgi:UPF0176 protein